jgi:hypothetical protein
MRILHYATIAAMGVAVGLQLPQIPVADKLTAKTLKNMAAGLGYSRLKQRLSIFPLDWRSVLAAITYG